MPRRPSRAEILSDNGVVFEVLTLASGLGTSQWRSLEAAGTIALAVTGAD